MKKIYFFLMLLASTGLMMSCSSSSDSEDNGDTDPVEGPSFPMGDFVDKYFSIADATFKTGGMPKSTTNTAKLAGITMNNSALANGSNFIKVISATPYKMFYIGVKGVGNYFSCKAVNSNSSGSTAAQFPSTRSGDDYVYIIPLTFGPEFAEDLVLIIKGVTEDDEVTQPETKPIKFVESMEGDLTINLTFDQPKDLDLHLLTPGGGHIYWNKRTWVATLPDGTKIEYGLDHDSNPACRLDYLNNENIVIPEGALEPGIYQVYLRMYENCDKSIGTDLNWQLVVRYRGQIIQNLRTLPTPGENSMSWTDGYTTIQSTSSSGNPVYGCYPYNHAGSTDAYVMDFQVKSSSARGDKAIKRECTYVPTFIDTVKRLNEEEGIH